MPEKEEVPALTEAFEAKYGLGRIIGIVDGTHIAIVKEGSELTLLVNGEVDRSTTLTGTTVGTLEDGDGVAGLVELVGGGESGRAGIHHGHLLAGAFGIGLHRDIDLRHHRINFGPGFPQGFARLARDQFGQHFGIMAHFIGETAGDLNPVAQRQRGPGRPCAAGAAYGFAHIAMFAAPHLFPGRRRV